jgi:predicted dehydrogenase
MIDNKLHIGIVGFGRLGALHAKNISGSDIARVQAVCDVNPDCLEQVKSRYDAEVYADIDEFLTAPLDGVVIASSTSEHLEHIKAVTKKGIPIFSEKPVGLTMESTDEILQEIVNAGVPFQIGFQRRWDPRYLKVKEIIKSGEIGKPVLIKAYGRDPNASRPENWGLDKNGGLFLNAAIHDYDYARFLFGTEVEKLSATGAALVYEDLAKVGDIDTCSTSLFFKDRTMAITEWSRYASYGYNVGMEVTCTEGVVRIGQADRSPVTLQRKNDKAPSVFAVFADAFKAEMDGFLKAIIDKKIMSPGVEDARIALQLALSARMSYQSNSELIDITPLAPLIIAS